MSSKNKAKGTAFETLVVGYINFKTGLEVERRALSGGLDKGDIIGVPDTVIECKNVQDWSSRLTSFFKEAEQEAENAGASNWVVVCKKRAAPVEDSFVCVPLKEWVKHLPRKEENV